MGVPTGQQSTEDASSKSIATTYRVGWVWNRSSDDRTVFVMPSVSIIVDNVNAVLLRPDERPRTTGSSTKTAQLQQKCDRALVKRLYWELS